MNPDRAARADNIVRLALWLSVPFNFGAAAMFALPESAISQAAGVPSPVPPAYSLLLAYFVALFGGAYAWLASRPRIDRPLVAMSAIGKSGAFAIIFALWIAGHAAGRAVLLGLGDLAFAAIFAWWVWIAPGSNSAAPSDS